MHAGLMFPRFGARGAFDDLAQSRLPNPFQRTGALRRRLDEAGFNSGYGWDRFDGIYKHLESEVREFGEAVRNNESKARQMDELGDVLYISAFLGGFQGIDPEQALHHANDKLIRRFQTMERIALEQYGHSDLGVLPPEERRDLWQAAKRRLDQSA